MGKPKNTCKRTNFQHSAIRKKVWKKKSTKIMTKKWTEQWLEDTGSRSMCSFAYQKHRIARHLAVQKVLNEAKTKDYCLSTYNTNYKVLLLQWPYKFLGPRSAKNREVDQVQWLKFTIQWGVEEIQCILEEVVLLV